MKTSAARLALLLCAALASASAHAQPPADPASPREIPVPAVPTAFPPLPRAADLPARPDLPDVLVMNDGTRVTSATQWPARRSELLTTLAHYAVGHAPPAPGNVTGRVVSTQSLAEGKFTYRLIRLTFGPDAKLSLDVGLFTPTGPGPFPVVIAPAGTPPGAAPLPRLPNGPTQGKGTNALFVVGPGSPTPGSASSSSSPPPSVVPRVPPADPERIAATNPALARGYAYAMFNHNDCGEDTTLREADGSWSFRTTRFFPAYPGYDWGLLASWAWGVSRIVDYLITDPAIDRTKLIVTGTSRTGKSAMVAAAFDDRLALGAPVVTGGGGIGAYRFAGPRKSETLDIMLTKYPNWFSPHLHEFRGQREKLPFDEHWFLAACAPRAFLALEGDADVISLPAAVRASLDAARPAYALFGATAASRLGVHYAPHGHAFTDDDWAALLDFADLQLIGRPTRRAFDRFPTEAELDSALARPPQGKR